MLGLRLEYSEVLVGLTYCVCVSVCVCARARVVCDVYMCNNLIVQNHLWVSLSQSVIAASAACKAGCWEARPLAAPPCPLLARP
jgi:hypothetical protein